MSVEPVIFPHRIGELLRTSARAALLFNPYNPLVQAGRVVFEGGLSHRTPRSERVFRRVPTAGAGV
jgi:hypothetical protein